jgi:hypothetical protein
MHDLVSQLLLEVFDFSLRILPYKENFSYDNSM